MLVSLRRSLARALKKATEKTQPLDTKIPVMELVDADQFKQPLARLTLSTPGVHRSPAYGGPGSPVTINLLRPRHHGFHHACWQSDTPRGCVLRILPNFLLVGQIRMRDLEGGEIRIHFEVPVETSLKAANRITKLQM